MEHEIFQCRQCGNCCHGETTVSLDEQDIQRMAAFLKITVDELLERYLRRNGNVVQMKIVDSHCIFYREGCTIHRGKPWRCTQWPLHPSILTDSSNFSAIKDSCPGLNSKLSYEAFCEILKKVLPDNN